MRSTLSKISFNGSNYYTALTKEISLENIPVRFGGLFEGGDEPFQFDLSEGGPLHYPGAPTPDQFVTNSTVSVPPDKKEQLSEEVVEGSLPVTQGDERSIDNIT